MVDGVAMSGEGPAPQGAPQPGWYQVEGDPTLYRYFDGHAWTSHLHRVAVQDASQGATGANPATGVDPSSGANPASGADPAGAATVDGQHGEPGPPAGWYPCPWTQGQVRLWDGTQWTAQVRPATDGPRRGKRLVLGAGAVAVALMIGAVALLTGTQDGASSPEAAAEELVAAVNDEDWTDALGLMAPDEVGWILDALPPLVGDMALGSLPGLDDMALDLQVRFGDPERAAEGVEVIPVRSSTTELFEGIQSDTTGTAAGTVTEEFDDEHGPAVVAVERDGGWYVSPLGTLLETGARADGERGAAPAPTSRAGADDPEQVVQSAVQALSAESVDGLLDVVDPEELQVLDHYRHAFAAEDVDGSPAVDIDAQVEGSDVLLEGFGDGEEYLDLQQWCVRDARGDVECLEDVLEQEDPLGMALPPLQAEDLPEVRLGTVERDDRHYLSVERTWSETIEPLLRELGGHPMADAIAGPRPGEGSLDPSSVEGTPVGTSALVGMRLVEE